VCSPFCCCPPFLLQFLCRTSPGKPKASRSGWGHVIWELLPTTGNATSVLARNTSKSTFNSVEKQMKIPDLLCFVFFFFLPPTAEHFKKSTTYFSLGASNYCRRCHNWKKSSHCKGMQHWLSPVFLKLEGIAVWQITEIYHVYNTHLIPYAHT